MSDKLKLLLIDGNNMCHRVFWSHSGLSFKGNATGVLYGFYRQLISLQKDYPDHFRIIAWDRGSARRLEESKQAVTAGIVPEHYKQSRREAAADKKEEMQEMFDQMDQLKVQLEKIRCIQAVVPGVEADDVIYTYCEYAKKWGGEAVVVSSDGDFLQVLSPGVRVYDAVKQEMWTEERFIAEFGFPPSLWVDVGALVGEVGKSKDNIFGVDGWGPVTANKYVKQYGDIESIIAAVQSKEKKSKSEQKLLDSIPRARLAKSLKKMDIIPDLPRPRICRTIDQKEIEALFLEFGMASLLKDAWRLA